VEGAFIVGSHPDETIEDLNMTVSLMKKLKPSFISIAIATPYPGTELRKIMLKRGLIDSNEWSKYTLSSKPVWRTEHFGPEQMVRLQKKIVLQYFLNPYRLMQLLSEPELFAHVAHAGFQFFFSKR